MMHDKLEFLEELKTLRKTRYNPELSDNIDSLIAKYEVEVEEIEKTYKWVEDNEEFIEQQMRLGLWVIQITESC